jgi:methionine synthase I (cobalamin-dependent)
LNRASPSHRGYDGINTLSPCHSFANAISSALLAGCCGGQCQHRHVIILVLEVLGG